MKTPGTSKISELSASLHGNISEKTWMQIKLSSGPKNPSHFLNLYQMTAHVCEHMCVRARNILYLCFNPPSRKISLTRCTSNFHLFLDYVFTLFSLSLDSYHHYPPPPAIVFTLGTDIILPASHSFRPSPTAFVPCPSSHVIYCSY
jgi:hypothetical protein